MAMHERTRTEPDHRVRIRECRGRKNNLERASGSLFVSHAECCLQRSRSVRQMRSMPISAGAAMPSGFSATST